MNLESNTELLDDFSFERNLRPSSRDAYRTTINLYSRFHNKPLPKLLKEAEKEEESGIRWKHRKLKSRLINFRNFLNNTYKKNYAKNSFTRILTVYKHYEIEIHDLPPVSDKNLITPQTITYQDLPDKRIIRKSLKYSSPLMKAVILFISSSGCAKRECLNLKISDFVDATKEYHMEDDPELITEILLERYDVIPTFRLIRQKTNRHYFTFCSPEATRHILEYLQTRDNLSSEDSLFDISYASLTQRFISLNNELKLGKRGTYNRLRTHTLRKFHASALLNDGMSRDDINTLQGKSKTKTDQAYFFDDPEKLKKRYIKHLKALIINPKYKKQSPENSEILKLQNKIRHYERIIEKNGLGELFYG